jgi:mitochondrial fission protein ELM1
MKCWIITEGLVGTENQCIGVAEALGVQPEIKRVNLRQPWKSFSPWLGFENQNSFDPPLNGPWPDLLIASGRKSIAASRFIKKSSGGKTFTVQIQDPRICPTHFDLVALPAHDPTRGDNVLVTDASPNRITDEKLNAAHEKFRAFEKIKSPRVAVLIGGDSKSHSMPPQLATKLADQLKNLNAGLMVTTSRRTGEANTKILKDALEGNLDVFFWDGSGENPYFGMLAWADFIIVTEDSASMISDAATTGKPVYVVPLAGESKRLGKMIDTLSARKAIRLFEGKLERWSYDPLRDSAKIAAEIRSRLAGHRP